MSFRRGLRLRPVKSEKEEVTFSNLASDASSTVSIDVITAVNAPTTAGQVEIGDTVPWVFCEINFAAQTITNPKIIHWKIWKQAAGQITTTAPSTYDDTAKRFHLKRGMEMLPASVSTVTKRIFVVRLPPRLRRMGDGDKIRFSYIATSAETVNVCGFFIFKHFG